MIITRAMSTQQTAITGVLRRITAGQEIKAGLCRGPEGTPVDGTHQGLLVRVALSQDTHHRPDRQRQAWGAALQGAGPPHRWCSLTAGHLPCQPDADADTLAATTTIGASRPPLARRPVHRTRCRGVSDTAGSFLWLAPAATSPISWSSSCLLY